MDDTDDMDGKSVKSSGMSSKQSKNFINANFEEEVYVSQKDVQKMVALCYRNFPIKSYPQNYWQN